MTILSKDNINTDSSNDLGSVVLEKDPGIALDAAVNTKAEFENGDAIENKGVDFQNKVNHYYKAFKGNFANMITIKIVFIKMIIHSNI